MVTLSLIGLVGCADNPERQTIEESHLTDGAHFGRSIDISVVTAVVGAYQERGTNLEQGAAYVFTKSLEDNVWSPQARLEPAINEDIEFGDAVAIYLDTIAVGAPLESFLSIRRSGAVHIFERGGSDWTEIGEVSSLVHQPGEAFGQAVALEGNTLLVGAPARDQPSAVDAGGAVVFRLVGNIWEWEQNLVGPSPAPSDAFGSKVDIAGSTLVVAAIGRALSPTTPAAGAVYVYENNGGTWTWAQTLTADDAAADDLFGSSVDLEHHADGSRRLVVGAKHGDHAGFSNPGAAYVFDAPPGRAFTQTHKLVAHNPGDDALFGDDVAVSGNRILIGAPGADSGASLSGAAYPFELTDGSWVQDPDLSSSPAQASGSFGAAVALMGQDALIGAPNEQIGPDTVSPGTAHAFFKPTSGAWVEDQRLSAASVIAPHVFGEVISLGGDSLVATGFTHADVFARNQLAWSEQRSLAALPDSQILGVSTDGSRLAIFGHRLLPGPGDSAGYVQIYTLVDGAWTLEHQFDPDLTTPQHLNSGDAANLGRVAILGDTLAIGAPRWSGGDGRVLVWKRSKTGWGPSQVFTSPRATDSDIMDIDRNFGSQVHLNGQTLAVAEVPSAGVFRSGRVYIYTEQDGSFGGPQVIAERTPTDNDHFGAGVAIDGDLLAIFSGASQTLRVYRRVAGEFAGPIWSQTIPDVTDARDRLAMKGDLIALGAPDATVNGGANAGEVRILRRQSDDSYTLDWVFHASDVAPNMRLGESVDMDAARVVAGTAGTVGKVYTFDL